MAHAAHGIGVRLSPPLLTPLQSAWLQELGLGRRFLSAYQPKAEKALATPSQQPTATPTPETAGTASRGTMFQAGELASSLMGKQSTAAVNTPPTAPPAQARQSSTEETAASAPPATSLEKLRLKVESCTACDLHGERHLPVVGAGADQDVALMVIGEAPGAEDDRVGQPFRGKAGELLQAMLKASGVTDKTGVYFTHLLKCRPVGNRAPTPEEVSACTGHLRSQIKLIRPKQLLVLGRVAAQALLGDVPVETLRGRVHTYEQDGMTTPVVVTYHPAALLSRPRHKAAAWGDLSLLRLLA